MEYYLSISMGLIKNKIILFLFLVSGFLLFGCKKGEPIEAEIFEAPSVEPIFEPVHFAQSKVLFINTIIEDTVHNFFNYNYIYNGAGVGSGDFNADGLQDLVFVSNQSKNRLFLNSGELKFENISETSGIESTGGWKNGVTVIDINQDGLDDIYLSRSGNYQSPKERTNQLFINNGDLTFTDAAAEFGLDDKGYGVQAYFFDYDRDGDLDMYQMNHRIDFRNNNVISVIAKGEKIDPFARDRLYENREGKYFDISDKAGIVNHAWGLSAVTGDFNEDSWPDIYVANDYLTPDLLYINNRDGTFTESIQEYFPHTSFFSMGSDWADIDNNGHFDLFTLDMAPEDHVRSKNLMASMSNEYFRTMVDKGLNYQYMNNTLQYNHGKGSYSEIAQLTGLNKTDWSWTALFEDFNNDGFKDLFVSNGIKKDITNNDAMIETDRMRANGERITLGQVLSLLPSEKLENPVYMNQGGLHFERINENWNINEAINTNGAISVDLDNDGDLELVMNNMDLMASIYKNLSAENTRKSFRVVDIKGPKGNAKAYGTEITFFADQWKQSNVLRNSRGYLSHAQPLITVPADIALKRIEIRWPTGEMSVIDEPTSGRIELDYNNIQFTNPKQEEVKQVLFESIHLEGLNAEHKENLFDDFIREILLPHRQSEHGPFIEKADVNNDGLEDVLVGGAKGQASRLFLQGKNGSFLPSSQATFEADAQHEDVGAEFFDFDGDSDLDVYIVSGSGEFYQQNENLLRDRVYRNDGNGGFTRMPLDFLPNDLFAGSEALAEDLDKDGDQDLIVINRNIPGKYPLGPNSVVYMNEGERFVNETKNFAEDLLNLNQMTVDGILVDLDGNNYQDLVLVGEWTSPQIFLNNGHELTLQDLSFSNLKGWWRSVNVADLDADGDQDIILGNIGMNNKYHPTDNSPLYLFYNDFDNNGIGDIVLSKGNGEKLLPVRGRECSSQQMPFILDKFNTYEEFANADLMAIYTEEGLDNAIKLEVNNFESGILWNDGGEFEFESLPINAQFGAINDIIVKDFNHDGRLDILTAGNFYGSEVETVRYDSNYGSVLINTGERKFVSMPFDLSGLKLNSDVRDLDILKVDNQEVLFVASNNDVLRSFAINGKN